MSINLPDYFELYEICEWIKKNNYSKVTLQFPDDLLKYSFDISEHIKTHTKSLPYILADTSYASCCVDTVAASHVDSEALIHFGPACLFAKPSIPVYYAFGNESLSQANEGEIDGNNSIFCQNFVKSLNEIPDLFKFAKEPHELGSIQSKPLKLKIQILLFYKFCYWKNLMKVLDQLEEALIDMMNSKKNKDGRSNDSQDRVVIDFVITQPHFPQSSDPDSPTNRNPVECSRWIPSSRPKTSRHNLNDANLEFNFIRLDDPFTPPCENPKFQASNLTLTPKSESNAGGEFVLNKTHVIYLGRSDDSSFTRIFFNYYPRQYVPGAQPVDSFHVYDPSAAGRPALSPQDSCINATLARRLHFVERGRQARIIGLITGILSDGRTVEVLRRLKKMIKDAGKKSYTFLFGKLNPHKLANFGEIEAYVLVACPETCLIPPDRAREFYRPVLTPWELEMACALDLDPGLSMLDSGANRVNLDYATLYCCGDLASPRVGETLEASLGGLDLKHEDVNLEKSLQIKAPSDVGIYTSHDYYSKLSWKGLELGDPDEPAAKVVPGRSGLASQYTNEHDL